MPELPEVETVVRDLRPLLVGRRVASVKVGRKRLRRRWLAQWGPKLVGLRVREARRRGKWIVLALDGEVHLLIHLGMTGQLTVTAADLPRASHTHVVVGLDGGKEELRFRDIRRFGSATFYPAKAPLDQFFLDSGLGPEPFDLDPGYWRRRLTSTRRCLKAALLDQRLVAGVGNIYADEALFEARLPPTRLGSDLSPAEADRLRKAVVTVLNRGIERRGATISNYVGGSGLKGSYQEEFRAYARTGKPCRRCRTPIRRTRLAGRATHFCPKCQQE